MNPERRRPLTPEQQQLVLQYEKYANFIVDKYFWHRGYRILEREEMQGVALLTLIHAAARYDPAIGATFMTFAGLAIQRKVLAAIERTKNNKCRVWHQCKSLEHVKVNPPDRRHSAYASIDAQDAMQKVRSLVSAEELELLSAHFVRGETLRSLARGRGISYQAMHQQLQRIATRVRERMPDLEFAL